MYDLGAIIKQLRTEKGYSQSKLANKINRSKSLIGDYESNAKTPSLRTLIDLADLFNVSLDYLAGIDKKEAVIIEHFSESQKEIMKLEAEEFADKRVNPNINGLTKRQQDIVAQIMNEFAKKKADK